jgi:hypothetical protein
MKPFTDPFPFRNPEARSSIGDVIAQVVNGKSPVTEGTEGDLHGDGATSPPRRKRKTQTPVPVVGVPTTPRVSEPLKTEGVLHEGGVKAALHDFMEGLPAGAVAALRPVMGDPSIRGGTLRAKVGAVLKRHGVPGMVLGGSSAQIVIDNWDTFHGG